MQDTDMLWESYSESKSPSLREQLILEYAPLVKLVAGRLNMRVPMVGLDDLIGYGVFGLIDAIDKYSLDKGVKFETYASIRIRGAILDGIRKMDWIPRSLRERGKKLEQLYIDLFNELGHEPSDEEVAEKLGMDLDKAAEFLYNSIPFTLVSLDDYLGKKTDYFNLNANMHPDASDDPSAAYEETETQQVLADAIDGLKEREKQIISLYYYDDLTLKEISYVMGLSESRVSQLHSTAMLRLKAKLGRHDPRKAHLA